jgi:hypothetical protein
MLIGAELHIQFRQRLQRGTILVGAPLAARRKITPWPVTTTPILLRLARPTLIALRPALLTISLWAALTFAPIAAAFISPLLSSLIFGVKILVRWLLRPRRKKKRIEIQLSV